MKRILLTLLLLGSNGVSASDCTDTHLSLGEPSEASVVLCRDAYAVGFSYEYKSPLWASYRTTYEDSKFICDKDPDFRRDPDVDKEFQATDSDYANNDWDKGHIAPRALMDITCPSEIQSVYYTNSAPQHYKMNRYGWKQLESIVREDWLRERGELVVVTGVHYPDNPEKMNNNVSIPTHFYKVVYDPELNEAISFWFPNEALSSDELIIGITTIEQIETDTGHELFSNLSKSKKAKIKELSLKEVW